MSRLPEIDVAKGITISLMVIGHTSIPAWLSHWIWSFHMPFFFIISGMTTNWHTPFRKFFHRKNSSLLWPLFYYSLINLILIPLYSELSFGEALINILLHGWGGYALWFIPVFYFASLLCKSCDDRYILIPGIILAIIGSVLCHFNFNLPWTLSSVPMAAAFMILGRYASVIAPPKRYFEVSAIIKLVLVLSGIIVGALVSVHWHLDMAINHINPVGWITIGATAGFIAIIYLSSLITRLGILARVIGFIGRNTLEILALSQAIILLLNHCFSFVWPIKYGLLALSIFLIIKIKSFITLSLQAVRKSL